MKTLVVGAGGVGGFFGGSLARGGADVTFLAHGENFKALQKNGLSIQSPCLGDFQVPVKVIESGEGNPPFDLILICVKAYHSQDVIALIESVVGEKTTLVSLQNGLRAHEAFQKHFGADKILGGLCYLGANLVSPGVVKHIASGRIVLGEFDGNVSARLKQIEAYLRKCGVDVETTPEISVRHWKKLVWNVGFNGPTALVDLTVGETLRREEQRRLIWTLMDETVRVGRACGVDLPIDLPEKVMQPPPGDPTHDMEFVETSMLHDRRAGRPLEWDIFYGLISSEGRRLKIPTPSCDLVGGLLKAMDPRPRFA